MSMIHAHAFHGATITPPFRNLTGDKLIGVSITSIQGCTFLVEISPEACKQIGEILVGRFTEAAAMPEEIAPPPAARPSRHRRHRSRR